MKLPAWVSSLSVVDRELLFPEGPAPLLVGADEVGLGSWAGPVTVCAVLAPLSWSFKGLADSKKLKSKGCEKKAAELLSSRSFHYAIRHVSSYVLDYVGSKHAVRLAFEQAMSAVLEQLEENERPALVVDGDVDVRIGGRKPVALHRADSRIPHVMAASILAKAQRDALMAELDTKVPGYLFAKHKGYGTKEHEAALRKLGLSDVHRKTYVPERALRRR